MTKRDRERAIRLNITASPQWLDTIRKVANSRYDGNMSMTVRELCRRAMNEGGLKETAGRCKP